MNRLMKVAMVTVVASGIGVASISAIGASPVESYALGKAKTCRVDYVKRTLTKTEIKKVHGKAAKVKIRYVGCVYVAPKPKTTTTATAPTTVGTTPPPTPVVPTPSISVHLDPTFIQNANNPFDVTYTASAAAETSSADAFALAPLPSGVLNFYSQGTLECSENVGNSSDSAQCPVAYSSAGEYQVVTQYISGTLSATETDTELISPVSTTNDLTVDGDPASGSMTTTLTSSVSSELGAVTSIGAGAIAFNVNGHQVTTEAANQTTCTINWSSAPVFNPQNRIVVSSNAPANDFFQSTGTSSNCTGTVALTTALSVTSLYAGSAGLDVSTSVVVAYNDWPTVPAPATVEGVPYQVNWGTPSIVNYSGTNDGNATDYMITTSPTFTNGTNQIVIQGYENISVGGVKIGALGEGFGTFGLFQIDVGDPFEMTFEFDPETSVLDNGGYAIEVDTWNLTTGQETMTLHDIQDDTLSVEVNY